MGKGKFANLILHSADHIRVRMTQTRHRGPARSIEILLTICIDQIAAITCHSSGQLCLGMAGKHVTHYPALHQGVDRILRGLATGYNARQNLDLELTLFLAFLESKATQTGYPVSAHY